jgi:hypothetical protein
VKGELIFKSFPFLLIKYHAFKRTMRSYKYFLLLLPLMLALCGAGYSQQYVYVNADSLILRDNPTNIYMVYAVLHAPCKLRVIEYSYYKDDKAITNKFYRVRLLFHDGLDHYIYGWVEKKYIVSDKAHITCHVDNINLELSASIVDYHLCHGIDHNKPEGFNFALYPQPNYKGGVTPRSLVKRVYRKGRRGGCYYINKKGNKVYVRNRFTGK